MKKFVFLLLIASGFYLIKAALPHKKISLGEVDVHVRRKCKTYETSVLTSTNSKYKACVNNQYLSRANGTCYEELLKGLDYEKLVKDPGYKKISLGEVDVHVRRQCKTGEKSVLTSTNSNYEACVNLSGVKNGPCYEKLLKGDSSEVLHELSNLLDNVS